MVKKVDKIINELILKLNEKYENKFTSLALFGSYAKGNYNSNSDIDLLILFSYVKIKPESYTDLIIDLIIDLEKKYKIDINPIVSMEEKLCKTPLMLEIADYSKIFVDKNFCLNKIFEEIKKDYEKGFVKKIVKNKYHVISVTENV